jgi:hypothetical protein
MGSITHYSPTSDADVSKRIKSATAAFGALKTLFGDKYLSEKVKGPFYTALVLSTLLYGCEVWSLGEDLFQRLRSFQQPLCPKYVSHQHRQNYSPKDHFRTSLSPF